MLSERSKSWRFNFKISLRLNLQSVVAVVRPAPLSSVVNRVQRSQAVTQATLINSVMNKVHEVTEEMGAGPSSR